MNTPNKRIAYLCGARDYHAMDWYKSTKEIYPNKCIIVTDLLSGEGYKKIITDEDIIYKLIILDKFLLSKQSSISNIWRNILKLLILPIQIILLKRFSNKNKDCIYHAHSMYYLVLARAAGVEYVGTPQGSDILVKPKKSLLYKSFAKYGLKKAKYITVDSHDMQQEVFKLTGTFAIIIQNGIDIKGIFNTLNTINSTQNYTRQGILSIRGFTPLYRIEELLLERKRSMIDEVITFLYPFDDSLYKLKCSSLYNKNDIDLGRTSRTDMYKEMSKTKLVISIPISDSSPRSVYESIFCGAAVAISYNSYYDILPKCMKSRIILIDLNNEEWLYDAIKEAEIISQTRYNPSQEALYMFDQRESRKKMINLLLN